MIEFFDNSTILIVNDIETTISELIPKYPLHSTRIIKNEEKEEFQIAQATQAIKEAYIASNEKNIFFYVEQLLEKRRKTLYLKF